MNDKEQRDELVKRLRERASGQHTQKLPDTHGGHSHHFEFPRPPDPDLTLAADMIETFGDFIHDVRKHGLRCDMQPTVMFYAFNTDRREGEKSMYERMTSYFGSAVESLKLRAEEAEAQALSTREVKTPAAYEEEIRLLREELAKERRRNEPHVHSRRIRPHHAANVLGMSENACRKLPTYDERTDTVEIRWTVSDA